MQEWLRSRLLYLEWALWPGLVIALPLIGAALTSNYLTKGTLFGILGSSLVAIGARIRETPRETWEDEYLGRELARRRQILSLEKKQDAAIEAVQAVTDKIQEVKDDAKKG